MQPQFSFVRSAQKPMQTSPKHFREVGENLLAFTFFSYFISWVLLVRWGYRFTTGHRGFWELESKQDLSKENKLETTRQLYHCPFHFLDKQSTDPVGESCAESPRGVWVPCKYKTLDLPWDLEFNLLFTDPSHQPWRTAALRQKKMPGSRQQSQCRK